MSRADCGLAGKSWHILVLPKIPTFGELEARFMAKDARNGHPARLEKGQIIEKDSRWLHFNVNYQMNVIFRMRSPRAGRRDIGRK